MNSYSSIIKDLPGPILVIGASGFVGSNILRTLLNVRSDVTGTFFSSDTWRLRGLPSDSTRFLNLHDPTSIKSTLAQEDYQVIFDCSSFGAYSFEKDTERIHTTNYLCFIRLLQEASRLPLKAYIHAGSSSEYGLNSEAPLETYPLMPNSHYAVSKCASAAAVSYFGKCENFPIINLRLYSIYGPYEDTSRLIPVLCEHLLRNTLPIFAKPQTSRDFIHIDDVVRSFVLAASKMSVDLAGESINIGTGIKTSLAELAAASKELFGITNEPEYSQAASRPWDLDQWYANCEKAKKVLGWEPKIKLHEGLKSTYDWWDQFLKTNEFNKLTKKVDIQPSKNSISAIIACYKDEQAIPIMYERLKSTFHKIGVSYEIIFVNDNSPDNSEEIIREISATDPCVLGISHSRNFGSQAAFRSGMELCTKEACVLLDGDLQDPPELIEQFVEKWRQGADIVYGRRVKREMPFLLEWCYKLFYRLFDYMSEIPMPRNAGDFSLIDRSAVYWLLKCEERDSFLRGLRSYVGFKQDGIDYTRPERLFGKSTNNILKNIGWAKKAIFSFSRLPLHLLTTFGFISFILTFLFSITIIVIKLFLPEHTPQGVTSVLLIVLFFGSITVLGIGILGEYIGKILEETKLRPPFIRKHIISNGIIKNDLNFK
ncbi:MAG: NAD-dependent epimerase/dehydratase family protein [Endomicrobium sp.]|jgi:dolichol-phosphate mannosyltransferase|nr:NAD-dependent epimerase/dehydratase family protein [Endomicrobium sp.]